MAILPDICVTLHPSSLRRIVYTPHSPGFASLDLGLFTEPPEMRLFTSLLTIADHPAARAHAPITKKRFTIRFCHD
jgi:hypothetical protein